MWFNKDITWKHVADLYEADEVGAVRKMPKLTNEHIFLNPFTKMRLNLEAHIMSETV